MDEIAFGREFARHPQQRQTPEITETFFINFNHKSSLIEVSLLATQLDLVQFFIHKHLAGGCDRLSDCGW